MQKESEGRVRDLRSTIREERTKLAEFESQLKDSNVRKLIQNATNNLDDAENIFLRSLDRESKIPTVESMVIDIAEFVVYQLAVPLREKVQKLLKDYGPGVTLIP